MISSGVIKILANKLQTTELNIRREYVQHLFLSYFYQHNLTDKIYFKGGTALRLIFGSPRFSEDLDFSASLWNIKSFEHTLVDTLQDIHLEGISVEVTESKETTGGYLSHLKFFLGEDVVAIEINISQRKGDAKGEVTTIASDFIPPYTIVGLSTKQLIEEKIQALLTRQKPRDFFDIYFILRKNLLSREDKSILPEVSDLTTSVSIDFEKELKQFLPKSHWPIIRDFKSSLEKEIQRT